MERKNKTYWIPLLLLLTSCLEPYQAPETKVNLNALVVEGFVDLGDNSASVRLSRTTKLSDKANSTPENLATVKLEEIGNGTMSTLSETQTGFYTKSGLSLSPAKKYRLHIQTTQGKTYASDDIQMTQTTPIDSVFWEGKPDGIHIYVATHDPTARSGYYLWDFVETWQNRAQFDPIYKIQGGVIVIRNDKTYDCWTTKNSTNILLESTKKLSQDIVTKFEVVFIPKGSMRLSVKYSVLVQQQVLTEESFQYWQKLQKTTQNVGGLFDPLPSQVVGNIHNVSDPLEPVMGYVTGGTLAKKRIFFNSYDLPPGLATVAFGPNSCPKDTLRGPLKNYEGYVLTTEMPPITTTTSCYDCRTEGGSLIKPPFWP